MSFRESPSWGKVLFFYSLANMTTWLLKIVGVLIILYLGEFMLLNLALDS